MKRTLPYLLVLLAAVLPCHNLSAQVDTGSVLGTVKDSSGAVAPRAKVSLTNVETGLTLSTVAGPDGNFVFTPVKIGTYSVAAELEGFRKTEQENVHVDVQQQVVVDLTLLPGQLTQTVEVTGAPPALQTQEASVGQVVGSRNVDNLPLNGRNFTFLAQLAAGVNTPQADTRGNAASGAFSANGLRPAQNNYLLDGIDNNSDTVDFLNGTNYVVLPPVDAVEEFKVQTSDFSAEYGRSGAAVLNATIKSGTNEFHGAAWEFFRNDKLDAADYFENAGGVPKGALRQNQFGGAAGGPVIKNKIFIFGDYEGFRRVQGTVLNGTVPTDLMRTSGFTDFTELLTQTTNCSAANPTACNKDALGRLLIPGTILDPATTRSVTAGSVDPVTGLVAQTTGFARDPFSTCPIATADYTSSGCTAGLNNLSAAAAAGRFDPNALKLLSLYPNPTSSSLFGNYTASPKLFEHRNAFDTRMDINMNEKNQLFFRFSLADDPQFIPGIFGGVADGGGFQDGNQTANAQQSALGYTHTFSPSLINVARAGMNYIHTTRNIPAANDLSNIPQTYGIMGIPQDHENGGLPAFGFNGALQTLGGNAFLPSDEVSSTIQLTDDLTKIYGKHSFKMGFEWQHVKFSTLQPPWSHGQFGFGGNYTDIPGGNTDNTGVAQLLLIPQASTVANNIPYVGGPDSVFVSNISLTDNGKNYYGTYLNDDWKITNKLTLNLGVRWDYFQPVYEHHGNQANFVPIGSPTGSPVYLLPTSSSLANLSPSFSALTAADGISVIADKYGKTLGQAQKNNFSPRIGAAYQITPKLVVRSSFGMFYDGFENRGFSPNLGENYPFQFNFSFFNPNSGNPINNFAGCATATPAGGPTFETGFSCTPLSPLLVNASGLGLRGIQFKYLTPYSMGGNLTVQYQVTSSLSVQAAYVTTLARHLEVFPS